MLKSKSECLHCICWLDNWGQYGRNHFSLVSNVFGGINQHVYCQYSPVWRMSVDKRGQLGCNHVSPLCIVLDEVKCKCRLLSKPFSQVCNVLDEKTSKGNKDTATCHLWILLRDITLLCANDYCDNSPILSVFVDKVVIQGNYFKSPVCIVFVDKTAEGYKVVITTTCDRNTQ